jgi:hypothetical protein
MARLVGIPEVIVPALREHLAVFAEDDPGAIGLLKGRQPPCQRRPLARSRWLRRGVSNLGPSISGQPQGLVVQIHSPAEVRLSPRATCPSTAVHDDKRIALDRHRRQILDLSLGEVEPDSGLDPDDCPDRDGHFLASPQVSLL